MLKLPKYSENQLFYLFLSAFVFIVGCILVSGLFTNLSLQEDCKRTCVATDTEMRALTQYGCVCSDGKVYKEVWW